MKKTKSVLLWFNLPPLKCSLPCPLWLHSLGPVLYTSHPSCTTNLPAFYSCRASHLACQLHFWRGRLPAPVCTPPLICSAGHQLFMSPTAQLAIRGLHKCSRIFRVLPALPAAWQGPRGMYALCAMRVLSGHLVGVVFSRHGCMSQLVALLPCPNGSPGMAVNSRV